MTDDKKDMSTHGPVYLSSLWHNLVQVIIQSRLGEKAYTMSKSPAKGSSMFNLEVNLDEEITQSIKKYMGNNVLSADCPFSVEILLRTKDGDIMVLEVWTLSMEETEGVAPQKFSQMVTDRLSILLKSAICISRITPAYSLSFRQSYETFVILYRLYLGKPDFSCLGENSAHVKVGQTSFESWSLSVSLAHRTVLTLPSRPTRGPPYQEPQMMLRSDHFKNESSPVQPRRMYDRVTDSSDTGPTSDESQDAIRLPFSTPMDLHSTSPRSRTSSESSNRGPYRNQSSEKIHVPFASNRPSSVGDSSLSGDLPFPSLLVSAIGDRSELPLLESELKDRFSDPDRDNLPQSKPVEVPLRRPCSEGHGGPLGLTTVPFGPSSNTPKDDNEYVVVDLKTPFVGGDNNDLELSTFFREWQSAPPLHLFSKEKSESLSSEPTSLSEQLKSFESCADEYENLVRSLHIDDNSSQELG